MGKRLTVSIVIGAVLAALPWAAFNVGQWVGLGESMWPVGILSLPGTLVALIFSAGNVHDYNFPILIVGNAAFYSAVSFWLLTLRERQVKN